MELTQRKEYYGDAFIEAVSAAAGFIAERQTKDLVKVDWEIKCDDARAVAEAWPRLEVQLKSTARDVLRDGHLAYPLDVETYDALREGKRRIPVILVVVVMPNEPEQWLSPTEESLELRHCAYWVSLEGDPPTPNVSSVTVSIPRGQILTEEALGDMMNRIRNGGKP